jgi:hypothetical protein
MAATKGGVKNAVWTRFSRSADILTRRPAVRSQQTGDDTQVQMWQGLTAIASFEKAFRQFQRETKAVAANPLPART